MDELALSRLLQLASPLLPVGAYSYSQGLEWGIESQQVTDDISAEQWIEDALHLYLGRFELPVLYRLYLAWQVEDMDATNDWNASFQAGRDTSEAWAETRQMGYSLCRLLNDLGELPDTFMHTLNTLQSPAFPTAYAGVAALWKIPVQLMLQAYAWAWLENQVSAAMKTVPLGQVAGQRILLHLGQQLPEVVAQAMRLPESDISNFAPGLSIAGCLHESQYSRLFRS